MQSSNGNQRSLTVFSFRATSDMAKNSRIVSLALMTSIYIGMRGVIAGFLPIVSVTDVSPNRLPGFMARCAMR